ncbi:MAG: phosphodiester glycosidase family protein [Clostridiales bacterium]|nr:phosphodiester glycosidase family protein [Clostridiales bacterium]
MRVTYTQKRCDSGDGSSCHCGGTENRPPVTFIRLGLVLMGLVLFVLLCGCEDKSGDELVVVDKTPAIVHVTPDPTDTPAPTATPMPTPIPGLLGGRYAEKFTGGGIEQDDWSYRSEQVSFTVEVVEEREMFGKKNRYFVVDIYLQDITALRTGFSRQQYWGELQNLKTIARSYNALLAISGVHYQYVKRGIILQDGVVYRESVDRPRDLCVLYPDGVMAAFDAGTYDLESISAEQQPWQVWSFGPTLVENGQARSGWDIPIAAETAPRVVLGYYEPGHYCFVLTEGRVAKAKGLTLDEMAQLMLHLGVKTAYNLDGGDTAQIYWQDARLNAVYKNRDLWDIIYIAEPLEK